MFKIPWCTFSLQSFWELTIDRDLEELEKRQLFLFIQLFSVTMPVVAKYYLK